MNGRKAKELRRLVYGDQSLRQERTYGHPQGLSGGMIIALGLRGEYQSWKKVHDRRRYGA